MNSDMPELLPCPLCPNGGKPWYNPHTNESSDNGSRIAMIGCALCGLTMKCANFPQMDGTWKLTKDLIGIWNTRPAMPNEVVRQAIRDAELNLVEDIAGADVTTLQSTLRTLIQASLSTQPEAVTVEELPDVVQFLLGQKALDGVWYGEKVPKGYLPFWWRNKLRDLFIKKD